MKLTIAAILASQVVIPDGFPTPSECLGVEAAPLVAAQEYYRCIFENSARLERSAADPEHIAIAARRSCTSVYNRLSSANRACHFAYLASNKTDWETRLDESVNANARDHSISTIVEIRAQRVSP
jgi:hypothetical protein